MWSIQRESFRRSFIVLCLFAAVLFLNGCGSSPEGEFTAAVTLTGGSGRASVESPCRIVMEDRQAMARVRWSSPNYDYMIVDGETYYPVNTEGNSEFLIPVVFDRVMKVQADTTAMSTPYLIDYELTFTLIEGDLPSEDREEEKQETTTDLSPPAIEGLRFLSTDQNDYAGCFAIHRYEDGFSILSVDDGRAYLIVPEQKTAPEELPDGVSVIRQPLQKIYLAASSVMCHFDALGAVDRIALSGLQKEDWFIDSAVEAMDKNTLSYGGKYSAPDYERMIREGVDLAIESTMILHSPKVVEKLEEIGIPVLIDRSSYEEKPLGRMEWIRVYGLLTGLEEEAEYAFREQEKLVETIPEPYGERKKTAVLSVNSNHQIVTRRKNDYMVRMIEEAGGTYLAPFYDEEETKSQVTISVEAFYDYAGEAELLIYNGTIEESPKTMEELLALEPVLMDLPAVQKGNVWYTDQSLYQYAGRTGSIMKELYEVIAEGKEDTDFFHRLR